MDKIKKMVFVQLKRVSETFLYVNFKRSFVC
jgi:hypothetical protein